MSATAPETTAVDLYRMLVMREIVFEARQLRALRREFAASHSQATLAKMVESESRLDFHLDKLERLDARG